MGGNKLSEYEVTIDYYDAIFNKKNSSQLYTPQLSTQAKLTTLLTKHVLLNPYGVMEFIKHIKPDTHQCHGFYKPWEWYHVYKDYPDILEYLIDTYYKSEFEIALKSYMKNNRRRYQSNKMQPFSVNDSNRFINVYDINEYHKVKQFGQYIIDNQLNLNCNMIISIAYMLMVCGDPKLALNLYKLIIDKDNDIRATTTGFVQNRMLRLVIDALEYDTLYSLNLNYNHNLLDRNTIFTMAPTSNNIKSFKKFLELLSIENGRTENPFVEDMDIKTFIKVRKQHSGDNDFITQYHNDDLNRISTFMPLYIMYMVFCIKNGIIEVEHYIKEEVYGAFKLIMQYVHNGSLIVTNKERDTLKHIAALYGGEKNDFENRLHNMYKLIIG